MRAWRPRLRGRALLRTDGPSASGASACHTASTFAADAALLAAQRAPTHRAWLFGAILAFITDPILSIGFGTRTATAAATAVATATATATATTTAAITLSASAAASVSATAAAAAA